MELYEVNPLVRFARVRETPLPGEEVMALDHRIFYCREGEGDLEIAGKVYHLSRGCLIFWRSGLVYRSLPGSGRPVIVGCNFDFTRVRGVTDLPLPPVRSGQFGGVRLCEDFPVEPFPDVLFLPAAPFGENFDSIVEEYAARDLYAAERCSSLLRDVLFSALRLWQSVGERSSKFKVDEILAYIRRHFAEPLTNERIAARFSYHPNYVSALVRERTGMPLHRYLLNYRVRTAMMLLESTDLTVTQVAYRVGFSDIKLFSRAFRSVAGMPPSRMVEKEKR